MCTEVHWSELRRGDEPRLLLCIHPVSWWEETPTTSTHDLSGVSSQNNSWWEQNSDSLWQVGPSFLVLMTLRKCISWFWNQDFDTQIPSEWFKELPKKYCDTRERISYLSGNLHSVIPGSCVQAREQICEPILFLECAFSEQLSWSIWKQAALPTEPSAYFSLNPWRAVFCL